MEFLKKILNKINSHVIHKMMVRSIIMFTLTILAVEMISYRLSSQQISELTQHKQQTLTKMHGERIDTNYSMILGDLAALLELPSIFDYGANISYGLDLEAAENLKATLDAFAKRIKRVNGYNAIIIRLKDNENHVVAKEKKMVSYFKSLTTFKPLKEVSDRKPRYMGIISKNEFTNILFAAPIYINSEYLGILELYYSYDHFLGHLKDETLFETGHMAIFEPESKTVIYHPTYTTGVNWDVLGADYISALKQLSSSSNIQRSIDINDINYEIGKSNALNDRWLITAIVPQDEMFGVLNKIRRIVFIIAGINILAEILMLLFVIKSLVIRPLNKILEATKRILDRKYGTHIENPSKDEFGRLAHFFNDMSDHLKSNFDTVSDLNANLEATVEERTKELSNTVQKLQNSKTNLENTLKELNTTQKQLIASEKLASLGEVVGGVAHEINTPLGAILLNSMRMRRLIKADNMNTEAAHKLLDSIEKTISRITKIIKGLLAFSRLDEDLSFSKTNIVKIVDEALAICEHKLKLAGISFTIDNHIKQEMIDCKEAQIGQVLINMINNAHDAILNLDQKWIKFILEESYFHVKITVIDSGSGVSDECARKLFQPFFTTKDIGKGTGLGLSISHGIMQSHKGDIYTTKTKDNHTAFIITLPKEQFTKA